MTEPTNSNVPAESEEAQAQAGEVVKAPKAAISQRASFKIYLQRVCANNSSDMSLSLEALDSLDAIMSHLAWAITQRVCTIVDDGRTISLRDVRSVVQLLFPQELSKLAIQTCTAAVTKCHVADARGLQLLSGLNFPISLATRYLRQFGRSSLRVSKLASVTLAAALQYIASEIIDLSLNIARDQTKKRIKNRHVMLAIHKDQELHSLLVDDLKVFLPSTGVPDAIHPFLVQKRPKKRRQAQAAQAEAPEGGEEPAAKKRRFHPGTVSLRNIRKLQRSTLLQLRRAPFVRYCRKKAVGKRLSGAFITALQSYTEARTVELFQSANAIAIHAQRQMVLDKDLNLAAQLQPQLGFDHAFKPEESASELPFILKAGIRRLSQRAGVKFLSRNALHRALEYLTGFVSRHMSEVTSLVIRDRKCTISGQHLRRALSLHGVCLAINLRGRQSGSKRKAETPEADAQPGEATVAA